MKIGFLFIILCFKLILTSYINIKIMKKIYLIISLSFLSLTAFSQIAAEASKTIKNPYFGLGNSSRTLMDTLWGQFHEWPRAEVYVAQVNGQNQGYVAGSNNFGDKQKVQIFLNNTPMKIEAVILWFGGIFLQSGDAASKVIAKAYNWNLNSPGNLTSSADLLVDDIDTLNDSWNIVTFDTPITVTGNFAAGIDLTQVAAGDYVGLFSSEHGGGNVYGDLAWEQLANDSWNTFKSRYGGIDVQLGIFPIVDTDVVGIKNIKNDKFKIYQNMPNPFSNTSYVFYELAEAANVSLEVFDMTGKSLLVYNEGFKSAGKSMIEIDATDLPSGIYHYTITIGDQKATKKMVVFK